MMIGGTGGGMMQQMLQEMRSRAFTGADADSSGGLSKDEFKKLGENGPPGMGGPAGPAQAGGAGPAGSASVGSVEELFTTLDADSDGSVTETELAALQPPSLTGGFGEGGLASLLGAQEESQSASSLITLFSDTEGANDTETATDSFDPVRILADLLSSYSKQAGTSRAANASSLSISA